MIRRKEKVEEIKLSAVPLGIVNGLKVQYVETTLKRGDWIIMMSDGVSEGDGIIETVTKIKAANTQTISDIIIAKATDEHVGRERDDMTVMVARIT